MILCLVKDEAACAFVNSEIAMGSNGCGDTHDGRKQYLVIFNWVSVEPISHDSLTSRISRTRIVPLGCLKRRFKISSI